MNGLPTSRQIEELAQWPIIPVRHAAISIRQFSPQTEMDLLNGLVVELQRPGSSCKVPPLSQTLILWIPTGVHLISCLVPLDFLPPLIEKATATAQDKAVSLDLEFEVSCFTPSSLNFTRSSLKQLVSS
jgi:hypothetical protein